MGKKSTPKSKVLVYGEVSIATPSQFEVLRELEDVDQTEDTHNHSVVVVDPMTVAGLDLNDNSGSNNGCDLTKEIIREDTLATMVQQHSAVECDKAIALEITQPGESILVDTATQPLCQDPRRSRINFFQPLHKKPGRRTQAV